MANKLIETAEQYFNMNETDNRQLLSKLVGVDVKTTPWCAAFVNAILKANGIKGTGSNLARSFLKWGQPVKDTPQPGDIIVFPRGNSNWQGHVGFVFNVTGGLVRVLGGNQGDKVCIEAYNLNRAIGIRTLRGDL